MKLCFKVEIAGLPITLEQLGKDSFRVTYWKQVHDRLTYHDASTDLGSCIMHALACDGKLDNRMKGER